VASLAIQLELAQVFRPKAKKSVLSTLLRQFGSVPMHANPERCISAEKYSNPRLCQIRDGTRATGPRVIAPMTF
jgi:hypothetical protein